jgi:NAD kinase
VFRVLSTYKTKIFVEEASFEELKAKDSHKLDFYEFGGHDETKFDLAIVIGGDGSILWTLKHFQDAKTTPPILAFSKVQAIFCDPKLTLNREL